MMKKTALASLLLLLCANGAFALFNADLPVSKRYQTSILVIVGKVTAFNPQNGLAVATTVETLKGSDAPATFQVHVIKTPELIKGIAVGQPVIVFAGKDQSVVHIGGQWAGAITVPKVEPRRWRTFQIDSTGHHDFPGSTAALVPIVEELKAGKYSLMDSYEVKPFSGGMKEIGKLNVSKPTGLIAYDIDGDGKPDLIVTTADGIKLFLGAANGYTDATEKWGLTGVSGPCAAADIDGAGKIALLIGKTLYRNDGKTFTADPKAIDISGTARVLAAGLTPIGDGKKPDAALLLDDGRLLLFKNPGGAGPWTKSLDRKIGEAGSLPQAAVFGDFAGDGTPGAIVLTDKSIERYSLAGETPSEDFAKLTGDPLIDVAKAFVAGMKNPVITSLDINGDKRPDLLITSDDAAVVLINRGFGAFLIDKDAAAALAAPGATLPLTALRARCAAHHAGGGDDLLILTDDGKLFSATTPPVKPK